MTPNGFFDVAFLRIDLNQTKNAIRKKFNYFNYKKLKKFELNKAGKINIYLFENVSLAIPVFDSALRREWRPKEKSEGLHFSMLMMVRISLWSLSWNTLSSINRIT
jgi:hypothetical protein